MKVSQIPSYVLNFWLTAWPPLYGQGSCICSAHNTGDDFAASGGWDSLSIRHAFIRKVKHALPQTRQTSSIMFLMCWHEITFGHFSHWLCALLKKVGLAMRTCEIPSVGVFFRCIWSWRCSSWSPQALWPYSHLCEYTERVCGVCACICVCAAHP